MGSFEDALIVIKGISDTVHNSSDDFFQDCCVAVLESGDFSEKSVVSVCQAVRKKHIGTIIREKYIRHDPIYTNDGENLDDNLIFVENPYDEENIGSRIPVDVKAKMKPLNELVEATVLLGKAAFHRNLFVSIQSTLKPKKVFKQQGSSVLLCLQNALGKTPPICFRGLQPAQYIHKTLFDLKKGKKNG